MLDAGAHQLDCATESGSHGVQGLPPSVYVRLRGERQEVHRFLFGVAVDIEPAGQDAHRHIIQAPLRDGAIQDSYSQIRPEEA